MSNWGQDFSNAFSNSYNNARQLAFQKWQTQQETQAKMFESGFVLAGDNEKGDGITTLFGQKFKFSPQIAAMKMAPWLAMTPGGMQMLNGMATQTAQGSQGQPNSVGGNISMPNIQMPGVGMPGGIGPTPQVSGSLNNFPPPNYMMGFPGTQIDPRYSAQLDFARNVATKQAEGDVSQSDATRTALQDFSKAAGSINAYSQNYDQALKEGSVGGKVGLLTTMKSGLEDMLGGDVQNQVKNYSRLTKVSQPDIALQLTRQILGGARGVASLSGWLKGSLPGGKENGDTARDMLQTTGYNAYRFMRSIASNGYSLADLQKMQITEPDKLEKEILPKIMSDAKSYKIQPDEASQVKDLLVGMTAPLNKYAKDPTSSIIDDYIKNPGGSSNSKFDFSKQSTEQLKARLAELQGKK